MLFAEKKLLKSGTRIKQLLDEADAGTANRQSTISSLLEKHFGTGANPNYDKLMVNVPANERGSIIKLIKNEINNQGRGELGDISFNELQRYKSGSQMRGSYDRSISTGKQALYRNFARQYGAVIREGIPDIGKEYEQYAKAKKAIDEHGSGIMNQLTHSFNKLPFFVRYSVYRQLENKLANVPHPGDAGSLYKEGSQNPLGSSGFRGY